MNLDQPINKLFLSAGVMKAGTTWLYSVLSHHPEIYFCPEKEIHFWSDFSNETNFLSLENRIQKVKNKLQNASEVSNVKKYRKLLRWCFNYLNPDLSIDWYKRLFINNNNTGIYNADFSNVTSHINKKGWEIVKQSCNTLKVVYILRNPFLRLWSHVKFHHQFIGENLNFDAWSKSDFEQFISKKHIWINCEYAKWISIMQESLSHSQFKIFYFEDFRSKPLETLKELENFLEIKNQIYPEELITKKVNPSKPIKIPANFQLAAMPLLDKETEKLKYLNINLHPEWNNYIENGVKSQK